jgi:hypothetical protein
VRVLNALEPEAQALGGTSRAFVEGVAFPFDAAVAESEGVVEQEVGGLGVGAGSLRDRAVPDAAELDLEVLREVRLVVDDPECRSRLCPFVVRVNAADRAARPKERRMKFMLLLWGEEGQWADMSEEETAAEMARWEDYTNQLVAAGVMVSGEGLQPSATSKTLRVENGERVVTDGPFAETKEQLGGFYVIECGSFDEALEWAAKVPSAEQGSTEIRPVIPYEEMGLEDTQRPVETQS